MNNTYIFVEGNEVSGKTTYIDNMMYDNIGCKLHKHTINNQWEDYADFLRTIDYYETNSVGYVILFDRAVISDLIWSFIRRENKFKTDLKKDFNFAFLNSYLLFINMNKNVQLVIFKVNMLTSIKRILERDGFIKFFKEFRNWIIYNKIERKLFQKRTSLEHLKGVDLNGYL